jgi:hypothetical protein
MKKRGAFEVVHDASASGCESELSAESATDVLQRSFASSPGGHCRQCPDIAAIAAVRHRCVGMG